MIPVPTLEPSEVMLGEIKHLPIYSDLPEDFKREETIECKIISHWFYNGLPHTDFLTPKDGVDKQKAITAIATCMKSWEPKHEHKIAGCGYLMHNWFDVDEDAFNGVKEAA